MLLCTSLYLLSVPHAKWYNVHRSTEVQSTALHLMELLSINFLGILQNLQINYFSKTSLGGYFKLTSDIFLESVRQQGDKIRRENHRPKHWKIWFFCMISTNLAKTGGGGVGCFILQRNFTSKFLENWNINYRQLYLCCAGIFILSSIYRSDSYKCTSQLSNYLCSRDGAVWFPFDDFDCHEKKF